VSKFPDLHIAIIRRIKSKYGVKRDEIIRDVSYDIGIPRKDVQQALAYLRNDGIVYRDSEGFYHVDDERVTVE